jgi:hypothetical protein
MRTIRLTLPALAALLAGTPAPAAGPPPADRPIAAVVDHFIDAKLNELGIRPAPQADDATLLRRLTLDLAGRIPTAAETNAYLASADPDKRLKLVERLLASPAFVRHLATELDTLLMAGTRASLRDYLLVAVKENRSWDRIFRDLLLPEGGDPRKGPTAFLKTRVRDLDRLTTDVSMLFFGVNISCARCHDHPLVPDWKQDHFYGMKSFFARTYDAGAFLGERDGVAVSFKTTKGVSRQAKLMFLTGTVVDDPFAGKAPAGPLPRKRPPKGRRGGGTPPPPPKFSARAALVELALRPGQGDFFARAIVNRVWHRLLGTGLVSPVDQMHSANDPSHPELLAWLAHDMARHNYDLRRLIHGLVLSRAYARSSRWDGPDFPRPQTYAVARLRALTPMQLATSLRLAATSPDTLPATLKPEELERRLEGLENSARGLAPLFEQPRDEFQIGVGEALLFSNSDRIGREVLAEGADRLLGKLRTIKDLDVLADTAVRNVLARPATAEEKKLLLEYLAQRKDRLAEGCRQMVWSLLSCSEFRFNH